MLTYRGKSLSPSSPFYPEYRDAMQALNRAQNPNLLFGYSDYRMPSAEQAAEVAAALAWVEEIWRFLDTPMRLAAEEAFRYVADC